MNVSIRCNALKAPRPVKEGSETMVIAMATINLDDLWVVENVRVLKKGDGAPFLGMPQYKTRDKEGNETWRDIAHPITSEGAGELRAALEAAIAEAGL